MTFDVFSTNLLIMKKSSLIFIVVALIFVSYSKRIEWNEDLELNKYIHRLMVEDKWYLWSDSVSDIPVDSFLNSENYLQELKFKRLDKWSYIDDQKEFTMYYDGLYIGHGFGRILDSDSLFRISYVYKGSPMEQAGIVRGTKILSINDVPTMVIEKNQTWDSIYGNKAAGIVNKFAFEDSTGRRFELNIPKDTINQNTVILDSVYTFTNTKIGYIVYNSFLKSSYRELDSTFADFQRQGVTDLVIDLRYNSGGELYVANYFANLIAGSKVCGQLMGKIQYNESKSFYNTSFWFDNLKYSIDINRVVFITSGMTASASEYLINVLRPYMEVVLVGEKTHGKPVGGRGYKFRDRVINLICFRILNSLEQGDYFNGIEVNINRHDDLCKLLGDTTEASLHEALFYLENSRFSHQNVYNKPRGGN